LLQFIPNVLRFGNLYIIDRAIAKPFVIPEYLYPSPNGVVGDNGIREEVWLFRQLEQDREH
jgi:hypothetical protein